MVQDGEVQVLRVFKQPFDYLDCLFLLSVALWVSWAASDMFTVMCFLQTLSSLGRKTEV